MAQTATRIPVEHPRSTRGRTATIAIAVALATVAATWALASVLRDDAPTSSTPTSALSEEEARAVAATYFTGWNEADYEAFSEHFDASMKAGITFEAFRDFRAQAFPALGAYVETTDLALVAADTPAHVTWVFTARFEREEGVEVRLTFPEDGRLISGAHILSDVLGTR